MDTRGKTNAEFRNDVNEILARHESSFDQLSFLKFNGDDPTGWIYKAEQYFDFKNITPGQQVQLAFFHLEGIALQWHMIRDRKFEVIVANREKIECRTMSQSHPHHSRIFHHRRLLHSSVAACQLVLGVQWLETLGPIEMDYKQLTMNFKVEGTFHTFQGLGRIGIEALSNKESNGLQAWIIFPNNSFQSSSRRNQSHTHLR
ncbi:hypothetical protein AAG906_008825 [Vitis piasezkii]